MPQVNFVREHRTVEARAGQTVAEIARAHGIRVRRETFAGLARGDSTCWVEGAPGAVSPIGLIERVFGKSRGRRRQASRVRVLGDVTVWTMAGIDDRVGTAKPVSPPPRPTEDSAARRLGVDAAGSAAFPYGDPRAVGRGEREPTARGSAKADPKASASEADAKKSED